MSSEIPPFSLHLWATKSRQTIITGNDMSEERVQISMSNTKKEMLEAYEALLADVQAKSLENPKEEQKRVSEQKVVDRLRRYRLTS